MHSKQSPNIQLNTSLLGESIRTAAERLQSDASSALERLITKRCLGAEMTGWFDFPRNRGFALLEEIDAWVTKKKAELSFDCVVVIGIGGSYLGTRACSSALSSEFDQEKLPIYYMGQHLSATASRDLLRHLKTKKPIVNVVSKSGTTTEPAVAFRLVRALLEEQFGEAEANRRIVATTDASRGALRTMARKCEWDCFDIPDDVGGRFSVLTAVGLLPLRLAGYPVADMLHGADQQFQLAKSEARSVESIYAAARQACWRAGKTVELLAFPEPSLLYLVEWWKQLYGESEGKSAKGIFPAGIQFTADLHSLGQYVQDGHRHIFESFVYTNENLDPLLIPKRSDNDDELQYLQHTAVDSLNRAAMQATMIAHHDGGVPGIGIQLGGWSAQHLGSLIAFFEVACALSADLFAVNAFDQPGVEAYKKNLFALLAKPGFEAGRPAMMKQLHRHGL